MFEPNLVIKKLRVVILISFGQAYERFIGVAFLRKKLIELVAKNILVKL